MKNSITLISLIGIGLALLTSVWVGVKKKEEVARLTANVSAALSDAHFYRTRDSLSAASVEVLKLRANEFEKLYDDVAREASNLQLKVRRLESASRTATKTEYVFETRWRDTVVYLAGRVDTIRCITHRDPFIYFHICDVDSMASTKIEIVDTLVQFVHRVPKKFLFFRFGTKAIRQEVTTKNPHTDIVFTEYIKLTK